MTTPTQDSRPRRLLSKEEVLDLCGVSYSAIFGWMKAGKFPLAIELGPRRGRSSKVAWFEDEVSAWIEARPRRQLGRRQQAA